MDEFGCCWPTNSRFAFEPWQVDESAHQYDIVASLFLERLSFPESEKYSFTARVNNLLKYSNTPRASPPAPNYPKSDMISMQRAHDARTRRNNFSRSRSLSRSRSFHVARKGKKSKGSKKRKKPAPKDDSILDSALSPKDYMCGRGKYIVDTYVPDENKRKSLFGQHKSQAELTKDDTHPNKVVLSTQSHPLPLKGEELPPEPSPPPVIDHMPEPVPILKQKAAQQLQQPTAKPVMISLSLPSPAREDEEKKTPSVTPPISHRRYRPNSGRKPLSNRDRKSPMPEQDVLELAKSILAPIKQSQADLHSQRPVNRSNSSRRAHRSAVLQQTVAPIISFGDTTTNRKRRYRSSSLGVPTVLNRQKTNQRQNRSDILPIKKQTNTHSQREMKKAMNVSINQPTMQQFQPLNVAKPKTKPKNPKLSASHHQSKGSGFRSPLHSFRGVLRTESPRNNSQIIANNKHSKIQKRKAAASKQLEKRLLQLITKWESDAKLKANGISPSQLKRQRSILEEFGLIKPQ